MQRVMGTTNVWLEQSTLPSDCSARSGILRRNGQNLQTMQDGDWELSGCTFVLCHNYQDLINITKASANIV